ncbi:MAG: YicC family protein [Lachnospiraceae bacterium]|nr:YicC family protein [Lachnospiraceae bacterium]
MVCSMTGFGRSEITQGERRYMAEIRSVNNRYLDLNVKLPRRLGAADGPVRALLKRYIKRGKVDVFVSCTLDYGNDEVVRYNRRIASEYLESLKLMAEEFGMENDIRLSTLARFPDVFVTEEEELDEDEAVKGVLEAVEDACMKFSEARRTEGEWLKSDLLDKLTVMESSVAYITERSPQIIEEYKKSLREKIEDLMGEKSIDENRLAMEVALFADKVCVDEELVRLGSHISQVRSVLEKGDDKDGIGRRLDFIVQEMNREANTILSKSTDLGISDMGIDLKTTIEKIREQIQNIE